MSRDTISVHFVNAALTGARRLNIDVDSLLARAGIEPELLTQPRARVSPDQYTRLAQTLWLVTQDEHLGFGRAPRRLGTFATMCRLIIHAGTLGKALERGAQFYRLFGDEWSMTVVRNAHEARLTVHIPTDRDPDHFITEAMLMIWHGLASWLIERRIPLERVQFGYAEPKHIDEYDALFFAPVMKFDEQRTELTFAVDYLDLPIRQTDASLDEFLKTAPAQLLVKFKNASSLTSRIRDLLKTHIGEELPTLNDVAARLYLSPQTLRRRLAAEGKSYQGVKDNLRRDAAIHLLLRPELSLEDVAQHVGFSETSTFHRAFKKWTGVTPGLYRQLHGS
jgi:AraC-like DNA-binding protein